MAASDSTTSNFTSQLLLLVGNSSPGKENEGLQWRPLAQFPQSLLLARTNLDIEFLDLATAYDHERGLLFEIGADKFRHEIIVLSYD